MKTFEFNRDELNGLQHAVSHRIVMLRDDILSNAYTAAEKELFRRQQQQLQQLLSKLCGAAKEHREGRAS